MLKQHIYTKTTGAYAYEMANGAAEKATDGEQEKEHLCWIRANRGHNFVDL